MKTIWEQELLLAFERLMSISSNFLLCLRPPTVNSAGIFALLCRPWVDENLPAMFVPRVDGFSTHFWDKDEWFSHEVRSQISRSHQNRFTVECLLLMSQERAYRGLMAWRSGNAFHPINQVTLRRAGLVLGWVTACGQGNHRYVTSRLGQLSLSSLQGS